MSVYDTIMDMKTLFESAQELVVFLLCCVCCVGSGSYDRWWLTSSLRGILIAYLKVQLLKEGIHSGNSGKCRDSFNVIRHLLDRFDDAFTGECKIKEICAEIPAAHVQYATKVAQEIGSTVWDEIPTLDGVKLQCKAGMCSIYLCM